MITTNNIHLLQNLRGAFQHECILNTLAHYIEAIVHLPDELSADEPPRAALTLATVAVCIIFSGLYNSPSY
jgi:hypothetical protein